MADAAIKRAENTGIIFIDEIDKIASKSQQNAGQVSREGVQRDILQLLKVLKFQLSMAWLRQTTFYSLALVLSMKVNQVI